MTRDAVQNKRSESTRILFMRAIEKLAAEKGLANVTTKEILDEAGQKNQSALQYHFGNKNELFRAVIKRRTLQLEEYRLNLINQWGDTFTDENAIDILIIPLVELSTKTVSGHNYVAFLAQAMTQPKFEVTQMIERYDIPGLGKSVDHLRNSIREKNPDISEELIDYKIASIFDTVMLSVRRFSQAKKLDLKKSQVIDQLRSICLAILNSK
ncbi:hypothetical protein GCM10017044_27340 [Kordiimonas sediminis]|uniref:HTH tetR-type domain-containing protein n=1 Tax=Kordiimonas sediminis TaxID=1735581 RepID=A0A919AYY7_9PROT|nr:helix-turn-helix domain-containing protein [Kordiimonas sediminis]GHF30492.1 hypothetical protein GCM10017044_27340 [Kordiimonas sediminis]